MDLRHLRQAVACAVAGAGVLRGCGVTTLIRERKPIARKAHRCQMCGGPINPGETYRRDTLVYDGRMYDWIECPACTTDGICTEVHAYTGGGIYDEGVGIEQADEWAHESADSTGGSGPTARRWLIRNGCDCEDCAERNANHSKEDR